ncbi:hypothetical protein B0O99DRAFT_671057 [Bisporella sp. PMI_857]|nr:hypothetical protein B0O99DRAFT_671057 [Bisporella sp. PMI_857]
MSTLPTVTAYTGIATQATPLAITTTFTPPPQCTEHRLTMLENQKFELWLNSPVPVENITMTACYPKELLDNILLDDQGSVLFPAFAPFICPEKYNNVLTGASGYFACCPSGYGLAQNRDAPLTRPGAGGTCYTNIKMGATLNITAYDSSSLVGPTTWVATTSGSQAYAYPIDGYRTGNFTAGAGTNAENQTSSYLVHPTPTMSSPATESTPQPLLGLKSGDSDAGLNKAAQIGTIIGSITGGLGLIATLVFGIKTLYQWKHRDHGSQDDMNESGGASGSTTLIYHDPAENPVGNIASAKSLPLRDYYNQGSNRTPFRRTSNQWLTRQATNFMSPSGEVSRICSSPERIDSFQSSLQAEAAPSASHLGLLESLKKYPYSPEEEYFSNRPDVSPVSPVSPESLQQQPQQSFSHPTDWSHFEHEINTPTKSLTAPYPTRQSKYGVAPLKLPVRKNTQAAFAISSSPERITYEQARAFYIPFPDSLGLPSTSNMEQVDTKRVTKIEQSITREQSEGNSEERQLDQEFTLYPCPSPDGYWDFIEPELYHTGDSVGEDVLRDSWLDTCSSI